MNATKTQSSKATQVVDSFAVAAAASLAVLKKQPVSPAIQSVIEELENAIAFADEMGFSPRHSRDQGDV